MRLTCQPLDLRLEHTWTIAGRTGPGGGGGADLFRVVLVRLQNSSGVTAWGESAPSTRYAENPETVLRFLEKVDPDRLSFSALDESRRHLESLAPGCPAAKCALDLALLDGAAQLARQPLYDFLGLAFREQAHWTSFSIGIAHPDKIRAKVQAAAKFPILKLKLGAADDEPILQALRSAAPEKTVRIDGNEAWADREVAAGKLDWLARDGRIEFVEQPMPAGSRPEDLLWLKARSPLPLMADESYRDARDLDLCARCFHAVNVKLVKAGGISGAKTALEAARAAGLKTMLGCMIESSVLISASAHLAELADYLDLDGNLLVTNDPFEGVRADGGLLSFANAPAPHGLRVARKPASR